MRPRRLLRTLLKSLLFGPLSRLPVAVVARVLPPSLHEPFIRFLVQAGNRNQGGAFLASTMLRAAATPAGVGRPVLIGGPARIGKSRAAQMLAERLGYPVLNSDHLHSWYGVLGNHREVVEFREGWAGHLLGDSAGGVILEGALLVMHGRHETRDARVCLVAFERWCREHDAVGFAVGCADGDRIRRLRAIEDHLSTCWTADRTRRERWNIVRHVSHLSVSLRREAERRGVAYREISPESFDADIESLVAEAEAELRGATTRHSRAISRRSNADTVDAAALERTRVSPTRY